MRVAVDATSLLDVRTGVGNFTEAVLSGLGARDDVVTTAFPVSLRGHGRLRELVPAGVEAVTPPLPARLLRRAWLHTGRPRIGRLIGPHDVVYGPNFVVPPSRSARVVTVHDLTPVHFPEMCTRDTLEFPPLIQRAAHDGAWIHTCSNAVRAEVIEHFDVDSNRVRTVHNGFTSRAGGEPAGGHQLAGTDSYLLAVGTVEPRKNLPGLLRAVDTLAADGIDVPLVHVGPDGWASDSLRLAVSDMRRPDLFRQLGRVSDRELRDLYAGARLVAYPSVYEGFGLPVLEAMSAGVPVVASQDAAIMEVAGGAATLVDINDDAALASALALLWSDEARRADQIAAGLRRAQDFSWADCVDGLVDLFRDAAVDSGRG